MTNAVVTPFPEDEDVDPSAAIARLSQELGGVLESMEELSDYLERVVHTVRRFVDGCDEVGITVVSGDRAHTAAYTTVKTLEIDAAQYALGEGPCLDAAATREPQTVPDLCHDDGRWPDFARISRQDGMRSLYAAPLISGDECVGAINLYAWATNAFDDLDTAVVEIAAGRCADAVVAVTALDGMRRLAGQLEQAMASRAVIEQAKGVIMAMRGLSEHDAFEVLRKASQDRNVKLRLLAEEFVASVSGPKPPEDAAADAAPEAAPAAAGTGSEDSVTPVRTR
ncbi:GAF and ANTAR domain-containing protein [Phycicoccus sp. BSK3Z-2]|uniref:GAF and ANTAR domain-containing protein n=1 Tax=Phycicoccus avicenniae TaxID=2828860 RepID=A0A941I1I0_9MICO|nr:GAF and ANTAR domain-containing protein [Phycicoccus avicenniae]MBR7744321.1 GAF and ANTAR domain-containing protein [Phycicoccus avicenniae]